MIQLVAIGELLIDFTPSVNKEGLYFKQNAGGAPCNMLAMAQSLGTETGFIGMVGDDQFGHYLKKTLEDKGVATRGLKLSEKYHTTLAFVHLNNSGERSFSFYREGCADVMLSEGDVDYSLIDEASAVHFGSLSFTNEPSKSAVLNAIAYAKDKGKLITYDPNYRPPLWENEEKAIEAMKWGFVYADIVKVSDEESFLLTDKTTVEEAALALFKGGIKLVCITLGERGSYYHHQSGCGYVSGFKSKVIDTTGAGDAFFGSLVHQIISSAKSVSELSLSDLDQFFNYSNAVASLCIEGYGGIPSLPDEKKILERLEMG